MSINLYSEANYTGTAQTISSDCSFACLQNGVGNDKLTSIKIPSGKKVTLYQNSSSSDGQSIDLYSDVPDLSVFPMSGSSTGWALQTTGIKITSGTGTNPSGGPPVTSPPVTSPPVTSPPVTSPPVTSPPVPRTNAPTTTSGTTPPPANNTMLYIGIAGGVLVLLIILFMLFSGGGGGDDDYRRPLPSRFSDSERDY